MAEQAFPTARPIALVGLMGAGKSTIGRLLASRLGFGFIDTDEEIERSAGSSIAAMFENQGEAHFRKLESALVDRLDLSRPVVLATGGGLFVDSRLRRRLLENCVTIWLDASIDQISERLARSAHRPLLDGDNPASALERMAEARHDAYSAAHLRIDCRDRSPDAVVEAILAAFGSDPANRAGRLQ